MTSGRLPALQWQGRHRVPVAVRGLLMLLACCSAAGAGAGAAAGAEGQPVGGFGIGDYEYLYDELPREHLARFGRDSEHVQHVPADASRARQADGDDGGVVQRVPKPAPATLREVAAPEAAAPEAAAAAAAAGKPGPKQEQEPSAELEPPPSVEGNPEDVQTEQAPQVPAAVSGKLAKEDMETANFFWGLGPVYPHLYVYRRVPHLVPLHGWNPYHAYLVAHPSR